MTEFGRRKDGRVYPKRSTVCHHNVEADDKRDVSRVKQNNTEMERKLIHQVQQDVAELNSKDKKEIMKQ